jgi:hypothetical protein
LRKSWRQTKEKRREDCESITTWDVCTCAGKKESITTWDMCICARKKERDAEAGVMQVEARSENAVNFESVETERLWSLREEGGREGDER